MARSTHPRGRRGRDERGAILALTSIAMIGVLAFASLAVDMGMIRAKRAAYQHTADNAALLAGWYLSKISNPWDWTQLQAGLEDATAAVKQLVQENLGIPISKWEGCTDLGQLPARANSDAGIGNTCISFNPWAVPRQTRIRLPNAEMDHFFGLGSTNVSAAAGTAGTTCDSTVDICTTTTTTTTTTAPPTSSTSSTSTSSTSSTSTTSTAISTTTTPAPTTSTSSSSTSSTTSTTSTSTTTTRPPTTTTTFLDLGS